MAQGGDSSAKRSGLEEGFRRAASAISVVAGSAWAFLIALAVVVVWAVTGPLFHYSNTWQLVINTSTTIITFLMVFLIQNTQNRDALAVHLKLDELVKSHDSARNDLIDLEECTDEELERLHKEFKRVRGRRTAAGARTLKGRRTSRSGHEG